ncbi:hypothetical protein PL321_04330 [Caloramator sp. mosi_1]|uniref:hypothetical protein n=1 Tax=Caloramator sp. mosi_1 TaxID=3023090 RepID=UPI00236108A6|nr:hypothetical protein [Caloramator sp. mosi_1]WDC84846.1 hypothetical protein PL321_04330 [Caloramator sp. mosi_1]
MGGLLLVENPYNAERITKYINSKINFTYQIHDFSDIESKIVSEEDEKIKIPSLQILKVQLK